MRIYFRHGLYRADKTSGGLPDLTTSGPSGLVAKVANSPIVWSIAHHEKNYTVSEYNPVSFASVAALNAQSECWLYVNLNLTTGQKTYGLTAVAPVYGVSAPSQPVNDQHWFDTVNFVTKVFSTATNRWQEQVRLIFGHFDGLNFSAGQFGSSVGLTSASGVNSGTIIYDAAGKALVDSRDRFVTTEDKMFSDSAATHEFSLEANMTRGTADENIPAFHVVKWTAFDTIALATYEDTSEAVIGISLNSATKGNPVEICIQGKIINGAWAWPEVNSNLWIYQNGEMSAVDPFDLQPFTKRRVPVARVIAANTVIFDQGLGGMGEKGDSGEVTGLFDASTTVKGIVKLSVAPTDPTSPVAVGVNDPVLTAPRVPLEHGHPATQVSVSAFGAFTGTNAQQALLYLQNSKLSTAGGTVTGNITSTVGATLPGHLTTLADVEAKISGSDVSYKRFDFSSSNALSVTTAFNSLSNADRTLAINDVVIVVYKNDVFLWSGGYGLVVAANDAQFMWIGKIDFPIPKGDVIVKTFVGTLVVLPEEGQP